MYGVKLFRSAKVDRPGYQRMDHLIQAGQLGPRTAHGKE